MTVMKIASEQNLADQDTSCKVVHGSRAQYGIKGDASLTLRASGRLLGLKP